MTRRHPKRNTRAGRFAHLPLTVLATPAVTTLGHAPFRVLVLLAAQFNGGNNGALGLTKAQAENQGIANRTLYRAMRTLEQRGLIELTYPASRTPPRPTMYALTWRAVDDTDYSTATRTATHDYREFKAPPRKKRQRRTRLRVVK